MMTRVAGSMYITGAKPPTIRRAGGNSVTAIREPRDTYLVKTEIKIKRAISMMAAR